MMRLCLAVLFFSTLALADFPTVIFDQNGKKIPDREVNSPAVNWQILRFSESRAYNGIGLVDIFGGGGCTGAFLDTGAGPSGPAYVLSNGHCAGPDLMGPDEVIVDRAPAPGMKFLFNYFIDAGSSIRAVPIRRIVYATLHFTDITIFELDATFGELVKAGFVPHRIDSVDPLAGVAVEMVGIPQSGVKSSTRFIRRSTCAIGGRANLLEGGYRFRGAFRHQCSSVGGSSGSPMISRRTGKIVAINNTGVSDGAVHSPECAMNRPCEIDRNGAKVTVFDSNYAQRVSDIPSCFGDGGVFSLGIEGCRLERR